MTGEDPVRDAGFDDFLDGVAAGEGYYLECPAGHGALPPRRACPTCGETDLAETPLIDVGTIVSHTVVHVPTPQFAADAPYVTAIAEFGPVRLTGVVRGVDHEAVRTGLQVAPTVEETDTTEARLLVLRPVESG